MRTFTKITEGACKLALECIKSSIGDRGILLLVDELIRSDDGNKENPWKVKIELLVN